MPTAAETRVVTRAQFRQRLEQATEDGIITESQADDMLAVFDAGEFPPEKLQDQGHSKAWLLALAALALLAFRRRSKITQWQWNPTQARYMDQTGKPLPWAILRRLVDRSIEAGAARFPMPMPPIGGDRAALARWQALVEEQLLGRHTAFAAVGRGGLGQMGLPERAFIFNRVLAEAGHLDKFVADMLDAHNRGKPLSPEAIRARLNLYNEATRGSFEVGAQFAMAAAGFNEQRNLLALRAKHCHQCPEQSALMWHPIGTGIPIGARACFSNDRCTYIYRRRPTPGTFASAA